MRALVVVAVVACRSDDKPPPVPPPVPDRFAVARDKMVDDQIAARGVTDRRVLDAMRRVPRHEFFPPVARDRAYDDTAWPIGFEQTISQPFVVGVMSEQARIGPGKRVLEVGTGSGYQAAILAEIGADVYSIEIVEPLAKRTHALLAKLGYTKIHLRIGDGYRGWPEAAPFDAIVVTAAPEKVPQPLVDQLAIGGRLVIPIGAADQELRVVTRGADGTTSEAIFDVKFVPMTGEAQRD